MKIRMPLWTYFLLIIVLSILAVASLYFIVFLDELEQPFIEEAKSNNEEISENSKLYLESKFEEQINVLIGIETAHHNIDLFADVFPSNYYETIIDGNEYINNVEVLNTDGVITYSSLENQDRLGLNLSQSSLIQAVTKIHEFVIGDIKYGFSDNELELNVVYSGEDGYFIGYLSILFFSDYGMELKETFSDKEFMIIDETGILLYDSKNELHSIRYRLQEFSEVLDLYTSNDFILELDKEKQIASVSKFTFADWYIMSYENLDNALAIQRDSIEYFTIVIIAISSVFVVIYLSFNYSVVREFRNLGKRLENLQNEDLENSELPNSIFTEVNSVREKFNIIGQELIQKTDQLRYLAYYDSLTNLPSKNKAIVDFTDFKKNCSSLSFIYFDLKRFGVINENFGFAFGDEVFKLIVERIEDKFSNLYRIDGDEFLIISKCEMKNQTESIINRLNGLFKSPIIYNNIQLKIDCNIGISHYPDDSKNFDDLLAHSTIAMQEAKKASNTSHVYFDNSKKSYYKRLSRLELLLHSAFERNEFITVYQPIVRMKNGDIRGFEALSRWTNMEIGDVYPDEFIPVLEKTHLISLLDRYVLNNAIKMIKFLNSRYNKKYIISINVSVETIMLENFTSIIDDYLDKYDLDPSLLEIEITESTLIRDFEGITKKMQYLINKGVKFSEDDFGDGFSSLTYLTRLNLDTLKISKNFLTDIMSNVESRYLVQTIINLSKKFGFMTIVEGVEDEEIYELFKEYNCDLVQGYLFHRPQDEAKLIALLDKINSKGDK